jgi:hypothetical protein
MGREGEGGRGMFDERSKRYLRESLHVLNILANVSNECK